MHMQITQIDEAEAECTVLEVMQNLGVIWTRDQIRDRPQLRQDVNALLLQIHSLLGGVVGWCKMASGKQKWWGRDGNYG